MRVFKTHTKLGLFHVINVYPVLSLEACVTYRERSSPERSLYVIILCPSDAISIAEVCVGRMILVNSI